MAMCLANELNLPYRLFNAVTGNKKDLEALFQESKLSNGLVVIIDEIHRLNRQVEELLYPAMEDFAIDIIVGKGPSANSIRLDLPRFTLIGATTRAGQLSAPLRDRFGVVLRLELYSPEDILQKIKAITREDVIYAAKGVKLHTIYKLLPKEGPIC